MQGKILFGILLKYGKRTVGWDDNDNDDDDPWLRVGQDVHPNID